MEKKPVYELPKVSRLDEKEAVFGGLGQVLDCYNGSNAFSCTGGNGAESDIN